MPEVYWAQNSTVDYFHHRENCKKLSKNILSLISQENKQAKFPIIQSYHIGFTDLHRCILFKDFTEPLKDTELKIKFNNKIFHNSYTLSYDSEQKIISISN